ncbi:hypothetical protein UA08_00933 [Talaromyces atroroseus]|uniref:Fe2OG dioxygenase domain-containing protein n=1 Tax=Talaromyces atroroseus TaxID=1441469 RepID=A0A225BE29_TALAT|nr:hypothetical protein UA08_00933 [Talaromyces atroroseus]OKL64267.1 hypothetical protein UA08_00933 [Talaromyces atroroseus]
MASKTLFEATPPFPDDLQPVAEIATISLAKLVADDASEAQTMLDACRHLGFFLLDLSRDTVGEEMIKEVDQVFEMVRETMDLSTEEKVKYSSDPPRDFRGYKAEGIMKTETGAPDRCEFYSLLQDDILGNSTVSPALPTPEPINSRSELLRSYFEHGHYALKYICRALSTQLHLPPETFWDLQAPTRSSGTMLRLIRYAPSLSPSDMRTGLLSHTDFGSITLLANVTGGLQVLNPQFQPEDEAGWQWVRPRPGCLIVNMGDAMVQWTGGILRSNMHRVKYAPGEQRLVPRYSAAILTRPYKEAAMQRLAGGRIPTVEDDEREGLVIQDEGISSLTAWEWELKKAMALKEGKDCARSRGGRELRAMDVA